jgi:hypothetical protein
VNRDGGVKCNVFLAISWKPGRGQNSSLDAVVAILRTGLRVMKDKLVPLTDLPDEPIHRFHRPVSRSERPLDPSLLSVESTDRSSIFKIDGDE